MRYLWWAEFQRRGALHYHFMLVDVPFDTEGEARRWFTDIWHAQLPARQHRTQPDVQFKSAAWFRADGGNYALKDARKLGGKHYQQDYSRMPPGWRTFRSHQLTRTAAEHELHETRALTVCIAAPGKPWYERVHDVWIYRVDHHVPARGGCRMFSTRSRRRSAPPRAGTPAVDRTSATIATVVRTHDRQYGRGRPVVRAAGLAVPAAAHAPPGGASP